MGSPPKPWEQNGAVTAASTVSSAPTLQSATTPSSSTPPAASTTSSTTVAPPSVPERPSSFTSPATSTSTAVASPYSYNSSPYSRIGGYGGYGSYGGLGGTYGGYGSYGGLGTYGGMGYGGYGGYGGYNGYGGMGMGMGMGGMIGPNGLPVPLDANGNPIPSLTQTLEATTQHTFALLHSIVQTFSGVAQMLESTFMATHSSFFAMVGVVDQFGQLRNALGSVLGLFGLVRWMKDLLTGRQSGMNPGMQNEFRQFLNGKPVQGLMPQGPAPPKPSKKPLIIFLLAIFGVPYAMTKLIKILAARAEAQAAANGGMLPLPGQPGQLGQPLDPASLTFARALYPFTASNSSELSLKENEIVAIMGRFDVRQGMEVDPRLEVEAEWWKGRTRDGREGWFPKKWVEVLQRKTPPKAVD